MSLSPKNDVTDCSTAMQFPQSSSHILALVYFHFMSNFCQFSYIYDVGCKRLFALCIIFAIPAESPASVPGSAAFYGIRYSSE